MTQTLGTLKAGDISFDPELPTEKLQAIEDMVGGVGLKWSGVAWRSEDSGWLAGWQMVQARDEGGMCSGCWTVG